MRMAGTRDGRSSAQEDAIPDAACPRSRRPRSPWKFGSVGARARAVSPHGARRLQARPLLPPVRPELHQRDRHRQRLGGGARAGDRGPPRVLSYAKNQNLGLKVPYLSDGEPRTYLPDFLIRLDAPETTTLVVEVKGFRDHDAHLKAETMRHKWIPAVNRLGRCRSVIAHAPHHPSPEPSEAKRRKSASHSCIMCAPAERQGGMAQAFGSASV